MLLIPGCTDYVLDQALITGKARGLPNMTLSILAYNWSYEPTLARYVFILFPHNTEKHEESTEEGGV